MAASEHRNDLIYPVTGPSDISSTKSSNAPDIKQTSYNKDAYTIVVNSLEDDSDIEPEEAKFVLDLPGSIDKTFAKRLAQDMNVNFAIPNPADGQLVLYEGRPDEIVARNLDRAREQDQEQEQDLETMDLD